MLLLIAAMSNLSPRQRRGLPAVAQLAETFRLEVDESQHPEHGLRPDPDEMIHALEGLPMRDRPWGEQAEYEQVASLLTDRGVLSFPGELGLTAEFPYGPHGGPAATGGTSHLLQVESTDNGSMGQGLRMTLRLREWPMDDEGQIFPPELNALEAKEGPGAHLLGSWAICGFFQEDGGPPVRYASPCHVGYPRPVRSGG